MWAIPLPHRQHWGIKDKEEGSKKKLVVNSFLAIISVHCSFISS